MSYSDELNRTDRLIDRLETQPTWRDEDVCLNDAPGNRYHFDGLTRCHQLTVATPHAHTRISDPSALISDTRRQAAALCITVDATSDTAGRVGVVVTGQPDVHLRHLPACPEPRTGEYTVSRNADPARHPLHRRHHGWAGDALRPAGAQRAGDPDCGLPVSLRPLRRDGGGTYVGGLHTDATTASPSVSSRFEGTAGGWTPARLAP